MRFYEIDRGEINIDGHSIKHYQLNQLREKIGIMPQDTFLFSGTIMENIRYGRLVYD
ncbi:hypothetical protein CWR48_05070 [Oceanobacillus arenosus]|uniref:Uncharacterized protein n=1 Tax=Oceanobacillus arenosus TaxID=1229153 RepID=A0A3D8PX65_9BACI|nr:hypothetical protein CWR48_05070 [Oceanobacillus arenosus]